MSFIGERLFRRSAQQTGGGWYEQSLKADRPKYMKGADFFNWLRSGRTDAQHVGARGLGIETMETFGATGDNDGTRNGMVRNPDELVKGEQTSTTKFVKGGSKVRKGEVNAEAHRGMGGPKERAATAPARKESKKSLKQALEARVVRALDKRQEAAKNIGPAEAKVASEELTYERLPRSERGYFESVLVVIAIEAFIVLFDVGVIHDALGRSGVTPTTAWMTSIGVPLLIWAANHTFGVLAGVIGLATPPENRRTLVEVAFAAGFALLMLAFLFLAIFRGVAVHAMNDALNALARGKGTTHISFYAQMYWLGFAQAAGSIAAISSVALWTIAKRGREQREKIELARSELTDVEDEIAGLDAQLEALRREGELAEIAVHEIEAEKCAAEAEIKTREQVLTDQLEAEEGLREAVEARKDTEYEITRKLYENGGVWRQAMPTTTGRFGRLYTPGPQDSGGNPAPEEPAEPSPNGHKEHEINPDNLTPLF